MTSFSSTINSDTLIKPLETIDGELSLWAFFEHYVKEIRAGIPELIENKNLIGLDYIIEMNDIMLKDVGVIARPFSDQYLCEIKDEEEQQRILRALAPMAEMAHHAFPLDTYRTKILRTLRDTVYRLREEGYLISDKKRVNKEVLFSKEDLILILLEKRMANKRIRKKRALIFNLPHPLLIQLLCVHPKDFNAVIEKQITKLEVTQVMAEDQYNPEEINIINEDPAIYGALTTAPPKKSTPSTHVLSNSENEITLNLPPHIKPSPALVEEILQNTATILGIKIGESEILLIKALSLKTPLTCSQE